MTSRRKLRVAQLGGGAIAHLHMAAFVENPYIGEVYLAEPAEEARQTLTRRWGIIKRAVSDYQELLDEDSVDLVNLAVPPHLNSPLASKALRTGKHVITGSPPALTLKDYDRMVQAARQAGRRLFAALSLRWHPAVLKARQLIDAGEIGDLLLGSSLLLQPAADEGGGWNNNPQSGGIIFGAGSQEVSFLQHFLGPARAVSAQTCQGAGKASSEAENILGATLQHGPAKLSTLTAACASVGSPRLCERSLVGTEGMLLIRDDPEDELPLILRRGEEFIPVPLRVPLTIHPWNVAQMLHHFIECLVKGKEPEVTLEEARQTLATTLALQESAHTGQRVEVRS